MKHAKADLPHIVTIISAAIVATTTTFDLNQTSFAALWMEQRSACGFPVLVADADSEVTGFGSFGAFRPCAGYLHTVEHSLYIDPMARGRGLGTALLAALVERARPRYACDGLWHRS